MLFFMNLKLLNLFRFAFFSSVDSSFLMFSHSLFDIIVNLSVGLEPAAEVCSQVAIFSLLIWFMGLSTKTIFIYIPFRVSYLCNKIQAAAPQSIKCMKAQSRTKLSLMQSELALRGKKEATFVFAKTGLLCSYFIDSISLRDMGNIECCDIRVEQKSQSGKMTKEEVKLQPSFQLTPQAQAKYSALVKEHGNDIFLHVPAAVSKGSELQSKQGFSLLPDLNGYYNGQWNQHNKPEGRGRIIFKNGSILVGSFKDKLCNYASCHLVFKDGAYYSGAIGNNKLAGKGKLASQALQYQGQWQDNLPEGKGDELLANGDRFSGTFRRGKKHGHNCTYKWYNNKVFVEYEGSFQQGLVKGKGTLHLKNGCRLEGLFKGQHIQNLTLKSKLCRYTGNAFNGKLEGKGTMEIIPRKQTFQGTFKEGDLTGPCLHLDSKNRRNNCFVFKGKKLAKVVGFDDQEMSDLLRSIEEVYSRIQSHEQVVAEHNLELNLKFNGEYLCEVIEPFAIQCSHHKYLVIHCNEFTIRILGGP